MSLPDEPGSPGLPERLPTRELLLAQALEACLTAERQAPGSAQQIIAQQPAWARADLQWMIELAGKVGAAGAGAQLSPEFQDAARARLMQHIGADATPEPVTFRVPRLTALPAWPRADQRSGHRARWLWRSSAGLVAALLALAATLTASASALPGEVLYSLKQAHEELNLRLAGDDQARSLALLSQADARLDETARLLQQGRTDAALATTQRYGEVVGRATTTYLVTLDDTAAQAPSTATMETRLTQQQEHLETILETAPEPARADLRGALVTTERGRALVADPRPVEQALGRSPSTHAVVAEAVPTTAAEEQPTPVPTQVVAVATPAPRQPTALVVVAQATARPSVEVQVAQRETTGNHDARPQANGPTPNGRAQPPMQPGVVPDDQRTEDQHGDDEVVNPPAVVAHDDSGDARRVRTQRDDGASSPNTNGNANASANANSNGGEAGRSRDEQPQQPVVVAHPPAPPAAVQDVRQTNDKPTGDGAPIARTTPPQIASPGERPNQAGANAGHEADNSREASPAPPARGQATTPTPTATPVRRGGSDNDSGTRATPGPARNPTPSPHSGDDAHGDDH